MQNGNNLRKYGSKPYKVAVVHGGPGATGDMIPVAKELAKYCIVLSGSAGGFKETAAQALAKKGYIALALAYFGVEGLPDRLENIPLEYFLNAIQWLKIQPKVGTKCVHLYGISRGCELAILLATVFPDKVDSVVGVVPSCATYGSYPQSGKAAWALHGVLLPIAPASRIEEEKRHQDIYGTVNSTKLLLKKIDNNAEAFKKAVIKVENIKCPLLLITGKNDRMWPSWLYGEMIMRRLDEYHSSIFRELLNYDNVGHMILPSSHAPVITEPIKQPVTGLMYEVGGKRKAQAEANKDPWVQIISFLECFK